MPEDKKPNSQPKPADDLLPPAKQREADKKAGRDRQKDRPPPVPGR